MATKFDCKRVTVLKSDKKVIFNGAEIGFDSISYFISQSDHLYKLKLIDEAIVNKSEFIEQRARGACNAFVGRPDLTFGFS